VGGYSNWSEEDNNAYADRTGTQRIGAGSAWEAVYKEATAAKGGVAPTVAQVDAALGRNQHLGINDVNPFNSNPNPIVTINRSNNTSNIDPQYNQPHSQVGKIWAFGNPDYEGKYKPVGNVLAELQGVQHSGTLYQSDAGRWQVIDKRGMLVMSGSQGAPPPKLITDESGKSLYDTSKWMSISNYVPPAKTPVSATPPAAELVPQTGNTLYAGTPPTKRSYDAGAERTFPVSEPQTSRYGYLSRDSNTNYSPFSQLFLQQTTLSPKQSVTQPVQKPVYNDNLFGISWGTGSSEPAITRSTSAEQVSNNNVVVKKIGDYDVYNDGTLKLRSTGETVSTATSSEPNRNDSSQKIYDLFNSASGFLKKYKPHLAGEFGAKHNTHKPKKHAPVNKAHASGFMDVFDGVKKSTPKKPAINPKNVDISSEILYINMWGIHANKKTPIKQLVKKATPIQKKKATKETGTGSAWSDVLFNKPKKTNTKKQK